MWKEMEQTALTHQDLIPELAERQREVEAIREEASQLTAGLDAMQFTWRLSKDRWSIADCLEHLLLVGRLLLPCIDEAIQLGKQRRMYAQGPFRYSWFDLHFVRSTEPKTKARMPRVYVPPPPGRVDEVARDFDVLQEQLLERIAASNGLDLKRVKASSPVNRLLRFSLGTWLAAIPAHERQHLVQAWLVRQDPRFPTSMARSTQDVPL